MGGQKKPRKSKMRKLKRDKAAPLGLVAPSEPRSILSISRVVISPMDRPKHLRDVEGSIGYP